jgi:hypothetical protein
VKKGWLRKKSISPRSLPDDDEPPPPDQELEPREPDQEPPEDREPDELLELCELL